MKSKRVFSLASMFLAGAAVCGCQSTNPTPPIRQQPWPSQTGQVRTTQPGMVTQNGMPTQNGMVMQNGQGGVPQYGTPGGTTQYTNTGGVTAGIPSTGYGNATPTSGLGGQPNTSYPASPNTTKYGPTPNAFPSSSVSPGLQQSSYNPSVGGAGAGGMSVTQTQCPPGGCPTCDGLVPPPPPTQTLPSSGRPFGG